MSMAIKALIAMVALSLVFGIGCIACVAGVNNECVVNESGIKAQYDEDRNNYSTYFTKISEMAQVPQMYVDGLKSVYDGAMTGRYGKDGSKAVFQFIQEHNPSFDASMYTRLQQAMEAGRNSFEADQRTLLDKKRVYEIALGSFPNGQVARFMGFPKIDMAKYDIVTDDTTEKAFATKRAGPIQFAPAPIASH